MYKFSKRWTAGYRNGKETDIFECETAKEMAEHVMAAWSHEANRTARAYDSLAEFESAEQDCWGEDFSTNDYSGPDGKPYSELPTDSRVLHIGGSFGEEVIPVESDEAIIKALCACDWGDYIVEVEQEM